MWFPDNGLGYLFILFVLMFFSFLVGVFAGFFCGLAMR